jgi:hypothetical protein
MQAHPVGRHPGILVALFQKKKAPGATAERMRQKGFSRFMSRFLP